MTSATPSVPGSGGSAGRSSGTDAFSPAGITWTPIEPALASLRRTLLMGTCTVAAVLIAVGAVALEQRLVPVLLLVLVAGIAVSGWTAIGRQVQAFGYAERSEDLLIRSGLMFRTMVVVPYGRMQFVDVQAGPLDRAFKIAQVQLHTASASSDAVIPGLRPEEAARLRDRLASRGQARLAGL
jgi:uncharacterized protein